MIVSLIVAMDEAQGIGKNNLLPWRLSDDLKRFKRLTMGHHLIMGRKTYESISRVLPGRTMIIVTQNPYYEVDDCLVVHSLEEAVKLAEDRGEKEVFVIGGGEIFEAALEIADCIYLTQVHTLVECDVFFPEYAGEDWVESEVIFHEADEVNQYPFTFKKIERRTLT